PTTALDVTIQAQILEFMKELRDKSGTTILMITHDLGVVSEVCERVIVMYAGTVIEEGETREVFENPRHAYKAGHTGSMPNACENQSRLSAINGQVPDPSHMPRGCKFAPRCPYVMDICRQEEPELISENQGRQHRCWLHQGDYHHVREDGKVDV